MTNHFHLVLKTPGPNLALGMKWLNSTYAAWYNRRHGKVTPPTAAYDRPDTASEELQPNHSAGRGMRQGAAGGQRLAQFVAATRLALG